MSREILKRSLEENIKILLRIHKPNLIPLLLGFLILLSWYFIDVEHKGVILKYKTDILLSIVPTFKNATVIFIGIVVGSYSIFQALLDDESLKKLVELTGNDKSSKFTDINIYFYSYTLILFFSAFLSGAFEFLLNTKIFWLFLKEIEITILNQIFPWFMFVYLIFMIFVSYEFIVFVRNLYDMFKITSFIRATKDLSIPEKIFIINEFLFNKNEIDYLSDTLTRDSYKKMKNIIGKDFKLDEAVIFIKTK